MTIYPVEKYYDLTTKDLFYLYVDNCIDIEMLNKKDKNYDINLIIVKDNLKKIKKELLKRNCPYIE